MNADELYKKHVFNSKRSLREDEVRDICGEILESDFSLEVGSSTLTVYTYKLIETNQKENCHFALYDKLLTSLEERLKILSGCDLNLKNVREDEFQLFISLVTSRWHWLVFSGEPLDSISQVLERDVGAIFEFGFYKESYSLNIFKTALFLSALKFVSGERLCQIEIAEKCIDIYKAIVARMGGGCLPSSSHFSDLATSNNSIEVILSGVEWVEGKRFRKERWNPSRIMHASSRVSPSKYPEFMDSGLKVISSHDFQV
ncbi:hypothetical protein [Halomonas sp. BMC6]|uniref:hypothetical protein n=1 Tax=Halomonas sp. BMC6 TaxID=3073244 RepID=UPI0030D4D8DA